MALKIDIAVKEINSAITNQLEQVGLLLEREAKIKCPAKTGQLKSSITHEVDGDTCYVGTNVEYAPYVEVGTGIYSTQGDGRKDPWRYQDERGNWHYTEGQQAQPFLQPALEENRDNILKMFEDLI